MNPTIPINMALLMWARHPGFVVYGPESSTIIINPKRQSPKNISTLMLWNKASSPRTPNTHAPYIITSL